jgi:hypothetical protein
MRVYFILLSLLAFPLGFCADATPMDNCDREEQILVEFCEKNPSKICDSFNNGRLVMACVF